MGRLARDGLHPDQNPGVPVGVWCDAAWSAYADLLLSVPSGEHLDALTATWDEVAGEQDVVEPLPQAVPEQGDEQQGLPGRRRPTQAERDAWGTSAAAQAGQANLVGLLGGGTSGGE